MRTLLYTVAVALGIASLYCLLWVFSSADLAATACGYKFSLSAPTFRCRQPQVAMILSVLSAAGCIATLVVLRTRFRRRGQ
jgi:hypothetical protein